VEVAFPSASVADGVAIIASLAASES
jgi:hypothetical protein